MIFSFDAQKFVEMMVYQFLDYCVGYWVYEKSVQLLLRPLNGDHFRFQQHQKSCYSSSGKPLAVKIPLNCMIHHQMALLTYDVGLTFHYVEVVWVDYLQFYWFQDWDFGLLTVVFDLVGLQNWQTIVAWEMGLLLTDALGLLGNLKPDA